ncbi:MAG: NADH-quinone oxidoreductase subunit M [bacterium]|nr:NADH-quinone oxidoreductase subunit M [bacterium]
MENSLSILALIFSPLIAAILLFLPIFSGKVVLIRRFSKAFASLHFAYSILFLVFFNPQIEGGINYLSEFSIAGISWIKVMGIKMMFGLDILSLLLVILTSFVFLIALIVSKNSIKTKFKFYYSLILFLETCMLGLFAARDMFLFFMFFELLLIPIYFLISLWGEEDNSKTTAMQYVLYTFLGSLFLLVGILLLHAYNFIVYESLTADFSEIIVKNPDFPLFMQIIISILCLIGFAIKMPIAPLHSWAIDTCKNAQMPVAIIMNTVMMLVAGYGIVRFNIELLPEAFVYIAPILAIFATINILYFLFVAFAQNDIKKIVIYSSMSSAGIILLGLSSMSFLGFSGAIFQMLAHTILFAGLTLVVGIVCMRTKTSDICELGGLGHVMPRLMGFALIICVALIGTPLMVGFEGRFLTFLGSFNTTIDNYDVWYKVCAVLSILSVFVCASCILKFLHKVFFANVFEKYQIDTSVADISNHEFLVLLVIVVAIIIFGLFPMSILDLVETFVENLVYVLQV